MAPDDLSDQERAEAVQACRGLAFRTREDPERSERVEKLVRHFEAGISLAKLDDQELQDAAEACRSLAEIRQTDAGKQTTPSLRELFESGAKRLADLAQQFEAARG